MMKRGRGREREQGGQVKMHTTGCVALPDERHTHTYTYIHWTVLSLGVLRGT